MAVNTLLYSNTIQGGIATVGNTLGLWGSYTDGTPDPEMGFQPADGIGAFTTLNTSSVYGSFPSGTTGTWQNNSSSNVLTIPGNSTIVAAYLFYSGTQVNNVQNVTSFINSSINLTTPSGKTYSVSPTVTNSMTISIPSSDNYPYGNLNTYYYAYTNVLNYIEGSGTYTVGAVPCAMGINIKANPFSPTESNHLGWVIVVAYQNMSLSLKSVSINAVFNLLNGSTTDVNLSGFMTPSIKPINAKLFLGVAGARNYQSGDTTLFGPTTLSLSTLSGSYNPSGNFYQCQINDDNGILSTTGTFGTSNSSLNSQPSPAARQSLDKTAIDVSSLMSTSQNTAVARFSSSPANTDYYFPLYVAFQVDSLGAFLMATKRVNKTLTIPGDILTYNIAVVNNGDIATDTSTFQDILSASTSFVSGSVVVNGVSQPTYNPTTGFALGMIMPNQTVTVQFQARVNSNVTTPSTISNSSTVNYTYTAGTSQTGSTTSNTVNVTVDLFRGVPFI